jgi:hypothetical protein
MGSFNQEGNLQNYRDQSVLNLRNGLQDDRLRGVQFANVQQFAGNNATFWNNDGRWLESRVAQREPSRRTPDRVVEFGSPDFLALASQLAQENRQSNISLRGEVLLEVEGKVVLVKNPALPADFNPEYHPNLQGSGDKAGHPAVRQRMESKEATSLIEAQE